ncbi:MAG: LysM peptidoglycan-binding domain-containing protein [Chloroflexi bacterium]|nr:LysM peptidoglycan-binding domain-containing protein [Ardenticatenaceae bacterium]NOG36401.1 LysM peptidoglycan-binding domain-containing protein [Chloroflexota bacterium]GIK57282.1 MAG: hypothetical protein BroJett015_29450 [Chloroflexota bacterium]
MQRWLVFGIVLLFLGLIGLGIVRQEMGGAARQTATSTPLGAGVPALSTAFTPALQPAALTSVMPTVLAGNPTVPHESAANTHTVQAGETLFRIAQQYGVTLDALVAANQIANPALIHTGQHLIIPVTAAPIPETAVITPPEAPPAAAESTVLPEPAATAADPVENLNGVPLSSIIVLPENVIAQARAIFAQGQVYGRNPHAYSKVGDSTIQNPYFMARFDEPGGYNLGPYAYLQPAVDYFAGSHGREGTAVRKGFHSWTVTDPLWADKAICQANETPIACEIRLHNPAIIIIRLGSNDAGVPQMFNQNVRQIVELAIANSVIPVIGTKADRFEGSNANNDILRQIAADYQLPLWDFDVAAQMIPGRGLDVDNVHLTTFYAHDYGSPVAFQRGHGVHNLTALMMLQALLDEVILPGN